MELQKIFKHKVEYKLEMLVFPCILLFELITGQGALEVLIRRLGL